MIDGVTEPVRTVVDCALDLPFDEALAIADSALRCGDVRHDDLMVEARRLRGPRSRRARRVLQAADGRSANPLESVLRAIALDVDGLRVRPQHEIAEDGVWAMVDLADASLRLVLEAEGFQFHGGRAAFEKDCRRYTELVCCGWTVLRFTWIQVMKESDWVRSHLLAAVALARNGRSNGPKLVRTA